MRPTTRALAAAGVTLAIVVAVVLVTGGLLGVQNVAPAGAQQPAAGKPPAVSSATCEECHKGIEPMHESPQVRVTCTQCHGGDGTQKDKEKSHVQPRHPQLWTTSANPSNSYGLLNLESPEFIQFVNPSDLRVADRACGECHGEIVTAVRRNIMATNPMVYHAGLYNNGVEPSKIPMYGEAFAPLTRNGKTYFAPAKIRSVGEITPKDIANGVLKELAPVPRFEISIPLDPFRILERGNIAASIRGPGTEAKIAGVYLVISKTRLNDPSLWLMTPNDVAGDFRQSGCAACHVVYANDREEQNSFHFAQYGNRGFSASQDPTIPKKEQGHPIRHQLTRRIPSAQCMTCHHHQGNGALNAYQGYIWWDQESDYDKVVTLGMGYPWWDPGKKDLGVDPPYPHPKGSDGTPRMSDLALKNPEMKNVQFGDAHGHGWHYMRVYQRDRYGRLLDGENRIVPDADPDRFKKAVHLKDVHLEKGMDCIDCHGSADAHGDGKIYAQMRDAIAIKCQDCHGTPTRRATLVTSGPTGGWDLSQERTTFGTRWLQRRGDAIIQNSKMKEGLSWEVKQVVDVIDPAHPSYNAKAARAMALRKDGRVGPADSEDALAHQTKAMECAACHASWNTGCYGCHFGVRVNTKTKEIHHLDTETRAYPDYFPQVIRPDVTMLGISGPRQGSQVAPFRPSNPVSVTVYDRGRNMAIHEQPTVSSPGFSGFAFTANPAHTIRTKETRDCEDCHVARANDNNAWLAAVLGFGTNAANLTGDYVYVAAGASGVQAVRVADGYEPRPVIGSWLHSMAYPQDYQAFVARGRRLPEAHRAGSTSARAIVRRGEFIYVADGAGGLRVYDIANVANKSVAQRIVPAPFSGLGNRVQVRTTDATAVALAANTPMDLDRTARPENQEQPIAPIFRYAFVTDSVEGLIVVDVNTFEDGNPLNNFIARDATYNPNGALTGAQSITIAGNYAYIASSKTGLHVVDVSSPKTPKLVATVGAPAIVEPRAVQVQFRYAFVVDREGLKVVDVTNPAAPRATSARVPLKDARDIYVMRTYAYVAAGAEGLAIVDIERPEAPGSPAFFTAGGALNDATAVTIGATYAGQYAYVADGKNGLKVVRLIDSTTPGYIGWAAAPAPELVAWFPTAGPAIGIAEGYKRDRGVDESGNQIGVSNRLGAHPFNAGDLRRLLIRNNELIAVENSTPRLKR